MFNTKRIKALEEELQGRIEFFKKAGFQFMEDSLKMLLRIQTLEERVDSYIPCSTCKCLIRKGDAIRGKSEIVEKHFGLDFKGNETIIEEIQKHFYCHNKDCKPKK